MPLDWLASATGDPALTKYRVAPQSTEGVPADESAYSDFYAFGGSLATEPQTIARQALAGNSISPLKPLVGKLGVPDAGLRIGDADPVNKGLLNFLANLLRKYTITTLTGGARRWYFAPDGSTTAATYLTLLEDNDVLPRTRFIDVVVRSIVASAAPSENLSVLANLVRGMFDWHGTVTQTTGSGSDLPKFRKTWDGQWTPATMDNDLYLQIVSTASSTYKGKVGAASSFGTVTDNYVLGEWNRLYNEQTDPVDRRVGKIEEQVEWYLPTGATISDGDVFRVTKLRSAWTPSYPVPRPISSVQTQFILRDSSGTDRTIRVEGGWEVTIEANNVQRRDDTAGRQSARVRRAGQLQISISPTRELADLDLQRALMFAEEVAVIIDAEIPVEIGTSGRPYRLLQVYPACIPQGQTFGVDEGAQNRDESVTLVAGLPDSALSYGGLSFGQAAAWVIENDITAL